MFKAGIICYSAISALTPVYGYVHGGYESGNVNKADRITFSTGVMGASTANNLSFSPVGPVGLSDKSTYGYVSGGYTGGGNVTVSTTDRITFSTSTTSARTVSNLATAMDRGSSNGCSDGSTYGYVSGGYTGATSALCQKMTFSTGVFASNTVGNLSLARFFGIGCVSDGANYGYFSGGTSNPWTMSAVTDMLTFSTGASAVRTAANLSIARLPGGALSDKTTYGYICGGCDVAGSSMTARTDRITYSTQTAASNTTSNVSQGRRNGYSTNDGVAYGYIGGGDLVWANITASAEKLTYSTGTFSASTVSNLSAGRDMVASQSDYAV